MLRSCVFECVSRRLFCIRRRAAPPDHPRWGNPHAWDSHITRAPSGEGNYRQPRVDSCGCWPERQVAPDFPFAAKPHPRTRKHAPRAPRVLPDTPYSSPRLVRRVRSPELEVFTCPDTGSRCSLGSWQILRSSPHSAAPPDHPRWCRQPARDLIWVVPCTCESDSNCSPLLRAARAQAAWCQEPALALKAQATPLPAPPRAIPVNSLLQIREAHDSRVACLGCCPNWPIGERQGSRAHHGRHHALGSESAWRAASARERLQLP
jgi:hypothetical protein